MITVIRCNKTSKMDDDDDDNDDDDDDDNDNDDDDTVVLVIIVGMDDLRYILGPWGEMVPQVLYPSSSRCCSVRWCPFPSEMMLSKFFLDLFY
jgi:hypothetical protein